MHAHVYVCLYWRVCMYMVTNVCTSKSTVYPGSGLLPDGTKALPESLLTESIKAAKDKLEHKYYHMIYLLTKL